MQWGCVRALLPQRRTHARGTVINVLLMNGRHPSHIDGFALSGIVFGDRCELGCEL